MLSQKFFDKCVVRYEVEVHIFSSFCQPNKFFLQINLIVWALLARGVSQCLKHLTVQVRSQASSITKYIL